MASLGMLLCSGNRRRLAPVSISIFLRPAFSLMRLVNTQPSLLAFQIANTLCVLARANVFAPPPGVHLRKLCTKQKNQRAVVHPQQHKNERPRSAVDRCG